MQAAFGELKRFNLVVCDYFESVTLTNGVARIDVPFRSFASRFGDLVEHVGFHAVIQDASLLARTSRRLAPHGRCSRKAQLCDRVAGVLVAGGSYDRIRVGRNPASSSAAATSPS
jgi:hypothetical protein